MRAVAERIEVLVRDLAASADSTVRHQTQELVQLVMRLYGGGLTRILQILELEDMHAGRPPGHTAAALRADDLVASLLVLHDLHPDNVETRIASGLERLQLAVGTTVTLLGVSDGTARVKVDDARQRETSALLDLRRLIEQTVYAVAPDLVHVEVDGLPRPREAPLVQLARKPSPDRATEVPVA